MTRFSLAIGIGLLAAVALPTQAYAATGDAAAIETAAASLAANQFVWNDQGGSDPITVVVSLATQQAFVYRGQHLVAATTISSGKDGKETPVGTFTILQKQVAHKSTLYNAAPMPYMERLTWDGVAIHAGGNPGFPSSHGCIHVPLDFAKKLYSVTDVGTTVIVSGEAVDSQNPPQPSLMPSADDETQAANEASFASTR